MGWHCDRCGGHSSYSMQGFRDTCADCGHTEGDWPRPRKSAEERKRDSERTHAWLRRVEASGQRDVANQDPRGWRP